MNDRQNEKSLDRSSLTECHPCKLTFDVDPVDVKEARAAADQGKNNHAVNDLPKVELVDTEHSENSRRLSQPRDICMNPDARDWAPVNCDGPTTEPNAAPSETSPPQPSDIRNGDVRDICNNPDAWDWAPAKCGTPPKHPRDMTGAELLALPEDVVLKYRDEEFRNEVYKQKEQQEKEDLREYERENRVGEYGPNAKASSY